VKFVRIKKFQNFYTIPLNQKSLKRYPKDFAGLYEIQSYESNKYCKTNSYGIESPKFICIISFEPKRTQNLKRTMHVLYTKEDKDAACAFQ
jgi:hypothetical protein